MAEKPGNNMVVVLNPAAGLLNPRCGGDDVEAMIRRRLPGARFFHTRSEAHATRVLGRAVKSGAGRVIVVGGDGTVHHAARVLAGTRMTLGVVSLGSANNIARSLNLPLAPGDALRTAACAPPMPMDLGRCGNEIFLEAAGVGYHASVLALYNRRNSKSLVRSVYSMARTSVELAPFRVRAVADGRARALTVFQLTISNLPMYGTNFRPAPHARPDDGLLHVTVIPRPHPPGVPGIFALLRAGLPQLLPGLVRFSCRSLQLETERPVPLHLDADARHKTPAQFRIDPGALLVAAPEIPL